MLSTEEIDTWSGITKVLVENGTVIGAGILVIYNIATLNLLGLMGAVGNFGGAAVADGAKNELFSVWDWLMNGVDYTTVHEVPATIDHSNGEVSVFVEDVDHHSYH